MIVIKVLTILTTQPSGIEWVLGGEDSHKQESLCRIPYCRSYYSFSLLRFRMPKVLYSYKETKQEEWTRHKRDGYEGDGV